MRPERVVTFLALAGSVAATGLLDPTLGLLLLPAFLLAGALLLGCFPGARLLERMRARRWASRRRRRAANMRPSRAPQFVRRVGRAVAFALAVRPPPAAVVIG